ncbi:MAG: radical SAM protein, partial [Bacteroidales bacterium]|nr:radical SAM protein [Bacteroidales bacterium]
YISITTNGQLVASERVSLQALVEAGLDEITLSAHGMRAETYEYLMPGADFAHFEKLIGILRDIKAAHPGFKIRLNFTVNPLNVKDLEHDTFWTVWQDVQPDIIQLRPVQKLGETAWTDFDLTPLKTAYADTIGSIAAECRRRNIVCIAPTLAQIDEVASEQDGVSALIEDMTYCYVSPRGCYQDGFDLEHDTYESFHRRMHTGRRLFRTIWRRQTAQRPNISKKLNYTVK